MIVVSDTSSLCNLAIIQHLWLLKEIYHRVIIPSVVAAELTAAAEPEILRVLELDWIAVRSLLNPAVADDLQRDRGLDAGEAGAIALALELHADDLLIDERLGRQEAKRLGLSTIGILGVLLVAKQRGLVQQVQPVMNALIDQAGFRVNAELYQEVLRLAGERAGNIPQ